MIKYNTLRCQSFEVKSTQFKQNEVLSFNSDFSDIYLSDDFKVQGKFLRKVIEKHDQTTYYVEFVEGQLLSEYIKESCAIQDQTIELILTQIIEGLVVLYQNELLGRCFNIDNIFWNGKQITMMNFGFFPSIWEQFPKYNHKLDVFLLGQISLSLILCKEKISGDDLDELQNAPVKFGLKEITKKMLLEDIYRVSMFEVVKYFQNHLSQEALTFFKQNYAQFCSQIDKKIMMREQDTGHLIPIIPIPDEEQVKIEKMPFLLFQNQSLNEDPKAWEELHEELYRIYLLTKLKTMIEEKFQPPTEEFQLQLKFIVDKTIIIQIQYLQNYITNEFKEKYPYFYQSSTQLNKLKKILKDQLSNKKMYLQSDYFDLEQLNLKIKPDQQQHFSSEIVEKNFNDIKTTFRWFVLDVYKQFKNNVEVAQTIGVQYEFLQLQFYVLLALILNNVMASKEIHFKKIKQVVKCNTISLNDIEVKFNKKATAADLKEQIAEIMGIYFQKN